MSKEKQKTLPNPKVQAKLIEEEMKESYIDYAMSVIVGRALPDVKDGLKPVHRRILHAMNQLGMTHNKPFKKSARIVGEVLGKYHPHGDTAVYDSMVRMAQDWSLRYPLIDGQGNFGSIDGDSAAAMRYTEARMKKLAEELLQDIEKETVKFVDNFDNSLKEPVVLPAKIPNLLINGSTGIAVGMATSIPPHNLTEVCDGTIAFIDNNEITDKELTKYVKGPDFPTGANIIGTEGIKKAHETGHGRVKIRATTEIEEGKTRQRIIVTEIPYMVNKSNLIENIAQLVRDKKVEGISDLRDESNKKGIRIVIVVKRGINPELVLNQLYKHSQLETAFSSIFLALVDNQPKVLTLKQIIVEFVKHRKNVITKRTQFDLKKAEERDHIVQGLLKALKSIDEVIKTIKASKDPAVAKEKLITKFKLTEKQSLAILDMKLQKLTSLETNKLKEEHQKLLKLIEELTSILKSEKKVYKLIKKELEEIKTKYGDKRRTKIIRKDIEVDEEELIKKEDVVVTLTHSGYVKRMPLDTYKEQKRGGKGIVAMTTTKDTDFIEHLFVTNTHNYILFFTNTGVVHWLKTYKVPEANRYARGQNLINLLKLNKGEVINAVIPIKAFTKDQFLVMATKNGLVKKTPLTEYSHPRITGIKAIKLRETDSLVSVLLTDGKQELIIGTSNGLAVKFNEAQARPMGRAASGVTGIRLSNEDKVIGMDYAKDYVLTCTENGYGKKTHVCEYRLINRGGKGVINIKTTERNGKVVSIKSIDDKTEIMLISKGGILMRTPAKNISEIGRNTQGFRMMKLKSNDKLKACEKIVKEE